MVTRTTALVLHTLPLHTWFPSSSSSSSCHLTHFDVFIVTLLPLLAASVIPQKARLPCVCKDSGGRLRAFSRGRSQQFTSKCKQEVWHDVSRTSVAYVFFCKFVYILISPGCHPDMKCQFNVIYKESYTTHTLWNKTKLASKSFLCNAKVVTSFGEYSDRKSVV